MSDLISREALLKYAVYVELANGNKGWVIEKGYVEDLPTVTCKDCKKWKVCECGKKGHDNGTSIGYSIGECKEFEINEVKHE